ncbi:hypothetical protein K438DRAFT_1785718 [Mycena galopus ATCC 62051]|nr:hypothetical protein K438DRAFT_1785718 [Mycena galopus ATCC 62051]
MWYKATPLQIASHGIITGAAELWGRVPKLGCHVGNQPWFHGAARLIFKDQLCRANTRAQHQNRLERHPQWKEVDVARYHPKTSHEVELSRHSLHFDGSLDLAWNPSVQVCQAFAEVSQGVSANLDTAAWQLGKAGQSLGIPGLSAMGSQKMWVEDGERRRVQRLGGTTKKKERFWLKNAERMKEGVEQKRLKFQFSGITKSDLSGGEGDREGSETLSGDLYLFQSQGKAHFV